MKIKEIYKKYNILPNLQEHHYRVAGLALLICDHWRGTNIDRELIKRVCLVHDIGNIIKFDLDKYPHLMGTEKERLDYWKRVKDKFIEKYGDEEHGATYSIAKEVGLTNKQMRVLKGLGFSKLDSIQKSPSWELKICEYSDLRVGPFGVVSLVDRLEEGKKRYKDTKRFIYSTNKRRELIKACHNIEENIDKYTDINIRAIDDKSIKNYLKRLPDSEI